MSDLGRDLGQWLGRGIIETTEDLADAFVSMCLVLCQFPLGLTMWVGCQRSTCPRLDLQHPPPPPLPKQASRSLLRRSRVPAGARDALFRPLPRVCYADVCYMLMFAPLVRRTNGANISIDIC